ncbi:MAG: hypothetical protein ACLTSZ_09270 [Lachnospiraceae bacterium]
MSYYEHCRYRGWTAWSSPALILQSGGTESIQSDLPVITVDHVFGQSFSRLFLTM